MKMQDTQLVCKVMEGGETLGILVVDRFVGGRAHGGLLLSPQVTVERLRLLARTMTKKYAFVGMPFGGAKAGVVGDPEEPPEERFRRLVTFARAIQPLLAREVYVPAADIGTEIGEIRAMLAAVGARPERRRLPPVSSGRFTGRSVFAWLQAAAEAEGLSVSGLRVAVEGFGKVGQTLAALAHRAGARVVGVSTSRGALVEPDGLDVPALLEAAARLGSKVVLEDSFGRRTAREALHSVEADVLCPCGDMHTIHAGNASEVRARILCPGANNPWTEEAEAILEGKGVLLIPEFAANTGGILGTVMAYATFSIDEIDGFIDKVYALTARHLIAQARFKRVPLRAVAEELARERQKRGERALGPGLFLADWGRRLHRRGLVPGVVVRAVTRRRLERTLIDSLRQ